MGVFLIQLICPAILFISVFYPLIRGWKRVNWIKSIALGWAFFILGCVFRESISPWIAQTLFGDDAYKQVKCANSYMLYGIAIGWVFPFIFHFSGLYGRNLWDRPHG